MKNIIIVAVAALLMSGCASKAPIVIDDIVEQKDGLAAVLITAPQRSISVLLVPTTSPRFDYYLNCLEKECKVASMRMDQHAVIYVHDGKQTVYAVDTTKDVDLMRDVIVINTDPVAIEFEAAKNKKYFLKHERDVVSLGTILPIIAIPETHLEFIGEEEAAERMEEVERYFLVFGKRGETFGQSIKRTGD